MRLPLLLLIPALLSAQNKLIEEAPHPGFETPRELAKKLLDSAYDGIGAAPPAMQADLLWEIGDSYLTLDHKKAREILERAFASSITSSVNIGVQSSIAVTMSEIDIPRAVEMLRGVQAGGSAYDTRAHGVSTVVRRILAMRELDRAIETLNLLGTGPAFPYDAAEAIIEGLHPNDPRLPAIFSSAINAYASHPVRDFPKLVIKEWRRVPRAIALQSLEAVVNSAVARKDAGGIYSVSYFSASGAVNLNSEAEIEIFDILPALRELEPERTKEVLAGMPAVARAAGLFPEGVGSKSLVSMSMQTGLAMDHPAQAEAISFRFNSAAPSQPAEPSISDSTEHARDLLERAAGKETSDPSRARELLAKALTAMADVDDGDLPPAIQLLIPAIDTADRLHDVELARRALDLTFDFAVREYQFDADASDPDPLPLAFWPSVYAFREGIVRAGRLYRNDAMASLDRIKNPDMYLVAQVALGSSLLDRFKQTTPISPNRKKKKG